MSLWNPLSAVAVAAAVALTLALVWMLATRPVAVGGRESHRTTEWTSVTAVASILLAPYPITRTSARPIT